MKNLVMGRTLRAPRMKKVKEEACETYLDENAEIEALGSRLEALMMKKFNRVRISKAMDIKNLLVARFAGRENEEFHIVFLDCRHRIIAIESLFQGTVDSCSIPIRPIVQSAIRHNAAACILAHQHPSGVSDPSEADRRLTCQVKSALALIDVRVLDHIIVAGAEAVSMAELGMV